MVELVPAVITVIAFFAIFGIEWYKHKKIEQRKIRKSSENNE